MLEALSSSLSRKGWLLGRPLEEQEDVAVAMVEMVWASFAIDGAWAHRRSDRWYW